MYYNPSTKEQKELDELKVLLNASIPEDTEQVGDDWFLLHYAEAPQLELNQKAVDDGIKLLDGHYSYTYAVVDMTAEEIAARDAQAAADALIQAKQARTEAVSQIKVEVDGMEFDGDEVAQDRMSRVASIAGADEQGVTLPWVLADNTVANVTVAQIKEALRKALYAQAALWVVPYTQASE